MARPMLCNTCVGYEDDGRFWTKDQNGARWIVYEQPATKGLWSGYSDQYGIEGTWTPAIYLGPYPYDGLINAIMIHGKANKASALKEPQNKYDTNFEVPFKSLPFTQTEGPPAPPPGSAPPGLNPPGPGNVLNPPAEEKKADSTGLIVGAAAVAALLMFATLKAK